MTRRGAFLFATVALLWGVPYLFIKIALGGFAPSALVFLRVALAAALLSPALVTQDARRCLRTHGLQLAVVAFSEIFLPFQLIVQGERTVSSSLTALLISACPLLVVVIARLAGDATRVDRARAAGLVVGFVGVALLVGFDLAADRSTFAGSLMVLAATASYAVSALLIRHWFAGVPPLVVSAATLAIAGVALAPAGLASLPARVPGGAAVAALIALSVLCTALALAAYYALLAEAGAASATVTTYVNPAIAVALGAALLHEPLHPSTIAGLLLVLVGSWFSTGGRLPPRLVVPARDAATRKISRETC